MKFDLEEVDILAIGAHPDDVEIGMGGTIAKHIGLGYSVGILDLTQGELGANGTPQERIEEGNAAKEILGCQFRHNLKLTDGGVEHSKENVALLVNFIKCCKPKLVFAPYYLDKHPDHVACGKLTEESIFMSTVNKFLPHNNTHQVQQLLFYAVNPQVPPSLIVDISHHYEIKKRAVLAHKSQFIKRELSVETEINKWNGFPEKLTLRDRYLGMQINADYGEGFVVKIPVPANNLFELWRGKK